MMKLEFNLKKYNDMMYSNLLHDYNLCMRYLTINKASSRFMMNHFYTTFLDYKYFMECLQKGISWDDRISEIYEKMVIIKNDYFE